MIDVVHDLLEGGAVTDSARAAFRDGFVNGGSGTWESIGSWLAKTVMEFPALSPLWMEFAGNSSANVRFRAASFVAEMPEDCAKAVFPLLLADRSTKVRSKIAGDQHDSKRPWIIPLLSDRRLIETDPQVIDSIDFALSVLNRPRK